MYIADGLLQEENEDRDASNGFDMGSRELLDNFTPSDPDMTPNGQGN